MTDELTQRAERAVADFENASSFLKGPFFQAQMAEAVHAAVVAVQSPWLDRRGAAAYCRCGISSIDRAVAEGIIHRYERGGTPLFLRHELDEAIRGGRWRLK